MKGMKSMKGFKIFLHVLHVLHGENFLTQLKKNHPGNYKGVPDDHLPQPQPPRSPHCRRHL